MLCDQKPLEKFLKSETENNKVNITSTDLYSYKLNVQYIRGTKNILADCLSRLTDAYLTNCMYESKGQELGCTLFEELYPVNNTHDCVEVNTIDVLDAETHDVKTYKNKMLIAVAFSTLYTSLQSKINSLLKTAHCLK